MNLHSTQRETKVHDMNNNETFNQIVASLAQQVNDAVYTDLLDAGLAPDQAYADAFHSSWSFEDDVWNETLEDEDDQLLTDAYVF